MKIDKQHLIGFSLMATFAILSAGALAYDYITNHRTDTPKTISEQTYDEPQQKRAQPS